MNTKEFLTGLWENAKKKYGPIKSCNVPLSTSSDGESLLRVNIDENLNHHYIVTGMINGKYQNVTYKKFDAALSLFNELCYA